MTQAIVRLEPESLWNYFVQLAAIPRCSKNEAAAATWIAQVGREHGAEVTTDAAGNVLLRVAATPGREQAPTVILQAHIDMVCEKNSDVVHDFTRDPIPMRLDGDVLRAAGTTLGADNGIGVAAALAMLDEPGAPHGPLELLFTVDEETGLTGANALKAGFLRGRMLLNLDSEDLGVFTIGSAGGCDSVITLPGARTPAPGCDLVRVSVAGLQGGHSGQDIHLNRGNSIRILARVITQAAEAGGIDELRCGPASGGSKRNAIPREAAATLALPAGTRAAFQEAAAKVAGEIGEQLAGIDDRLRVEVAPAGDADAAGLFCAPQDSHRLLHLLNALPHGVLAMSTEIEGLVETSTNLGVLDDQGEAYRITLGSRSASSEALRGTLLQIRSAAHLAGAAIVQGEGYPAWKPKLGTPLLRTVERVYQRLFDEQPSFEAIHAGLECGLFLGQYPDLQVVSFGPDIKEPHSPNERVYVGSVAKFWAFTKALLAELGLPQA